MECSAVFFHRDPRASSRQTSSPLSCPLCALLDAVAGACLRRFKLDKSRVLMVGDRLDTDIAFGINGAVDTLLVTDTGRFTHASAPGRGMCAAGLGRPLRSPNDFFAVRSLTLAPIVCVVASVATGRHSHAGRCARERRAVDLFARQRHAVAGVRDRTRCCFPSAPTVVAKCVFLCQPGGGKQVASRAPRSRGNSTTSRLALLCCSNRAPDAPRPHWSINTAEIAAVSCDQSFSARFGGWNFRPSPSSACSLAARSSLCHSLTRAPIVHLCI